jgi:hypothetical protein
MTLYKVTATLKDGAQFSELMEAHDWQDAIDRGRDRWRTAVTVDADDTVYELRIHADYALVGPSVLRGREYAEECLRQFAKGAGLDLHIHPTAYSDSAVSTAFTRGGDAFLDAVASLRRRF